MSLEAMDRERFTSYVPTPSERRPFKEYATTVAMHWDETYRDRYYGSAGFYRGIPGPWYFTAKQIAKHLKDSDR